ncbi:MAG: hypothetical protein WAT39_20530 [Planctomycetota bacterium]
MPHTRSSLVAGLALPLGAAISLTSSLAAQCTNPWPTVLGSSGVEGSVSDTLLFDPDGPGPLGERVLVAGSFQVAGTALADNLAVYDPATRTFAPFGPGPYPGGMLLTRASNGDIYVAGNFQSIAGVSASRVARWDGTTWSALGAGVNGYVWRLIARPGGGIVVTGDFSQAGGLPTSDIAAWDGSSWSPLGSTALGSPSFTTVAALPNGDLCASGVALFGTTNFTGVLRFDGTAWSTLGAAFPSAPQMLLALPNGEIVAGGNSVPGGTQDRVARWTGTNWVVLPGAPFQFVLELLMLPSGVLVAAGRYTSSSAIRVATWDGSVWTGLGDVPFGGYVTSSLSVLASGELLLAGDFAAIDNTAARSLARWNGVTWSPASPGLVGSMQWTAVRADGSLFLGAAYGALGQGLVVRWNGVSWTPIGGGFAGYDTSNLTSLVALPNGDLLAGGLAWSAAPQPILQRWSGSAWSTLATATSGNRVFAAVELANGDLVVGGNFVSLSGVAVTNVARFDGTTWSPLGAGVSAAVVALAISPSGVLHALTGTSVFRWNGAQWVQLGLSQPGAMAIVFGNDGAPILGGGFSGATVLRWDGSSWSPLGAGPGGAVRSLAFLPDGDLVAGPWIGTGEAPRPLQRWNGVTWTPIGGPIDATVWSLANALNGDLLLSGDFRIADGVPRCRFARVSTSCPATVATLPGGCSGFNLPTLVANVLPWLGGTCRTTAATLPANSLALIVNGLTATATPLTSLLPQATFGCQLLAAPDVVQLAVPVAGVVRPQFAVPDTMALLGIAVRQQVLPVVLDGGGAITTVQATNALLFQIGSF